MSEYIAETFKHKSLTIKIIADESPLNPRKDYDNAGTMVCFHTRYDLGDETRRDGPHEWLDSLAEDAKEGTLEWLDNGLYERMAKTEATEYKRRRAELVWKIIDKHYIIRPLALLDHSGLHMWIGSGPHWTDSAGWDSGQVGWIYMTKKKAVEEWGKKKCTKKVIEQANKCMEGEVETYDQYLTGDVWGFVIEDEEGKNVDSCWGHFGIGWCKQAAIDAADCHLRYEAKEVPTADIPMVARP